MCFSEPIRRRKEDLIDDALVYMAPVCKLQKATLPRLTQPPQDLALGKDSAG